jgi:hypothetical protein
VQTWSGFYAVVGTAAATLMGLLFVAVSMNAAAVLTQTDDPARGLAEQAFQNYLTVLVIALVSLFPDITMRTFGLVILGLTALSSVWLLIHFHQALTRPRGGDSRLRALRRHFSSLIGFGMMIYAAVRMALRVGDSHEWLGAAAVVLLVSATTVSWELLARIASVARTGPA